MTVLKIVTAIVLVILSIFMFLLPEETVSKFFLSKTSMNGIATIVLMVGILFALSYFSRTVTTKLINKLRAPNSVTTIVPEVPLTKPVPEVSSTKPVPEVTE